MTEWLPDDRRLRALSFWIDGEYWSDYEYDIKGTPCEPVIEGRDVVHIPERLLELFPGDPDLRPLGVVSYLGHALLDTDLSHESPRLAGCYHLGQPVSLGPPRDDRRAYLRVALGSSMVTEFARQPDAGGAWMREQLASVRTKIEMLVHQGRFQE